MAEAVTYKAGDRVKLLVRGDHRGDGEKGPLAGSIGVVQSIYAESCDHPYKGQQLLCVKWEGYSAGDGTWYVNVGRIAPVEAAKPRKEASSVNVWEIAAKVAPVADRVLYDGPPGTGKTFAAQRFGVGPGQPVFNLTCTEEMPAAELRGHFVPKGHEFVWMDGPAVRAMREGGRLVINEIEKASGDVQTLLLAILDDPESCALTLPTSETVRPTTGYTVAATMNGDADMDLPEALRSRFVVRLRIEEVHPDAIKRLPEDLQAAARQTGGPVEAERRITIRSWLEFAKLRPKVGQEVAAQAVFGARAGDVLEAIRMKTISTKRAAL